MAPIHYLDFVLIATGTIIGAFWPKPNIYSTGFILLLLFGVVAIASSHFPQNGWEVVDCKNDFLNQLLPCFTKTQSFVGRSPHPFAVAGLAILLGCLVAILRNLISRWKA